METFKFVVVLQVEAPAFSAEDAKEVLLDSFDTGDDGGFIITDVTIKEAK